MSRGLAEQLKALLEGSQPREPAAPIPRRKPNPLYSSNKQSGSGSQLGSRRRSKSNPSSPIGISKARDPTRNTSGAGSRRQHNAARGGLPRGAVSTGTSPVSKQPPLQHLPASLRQLDFGGHAAAGPRLALSPSSPTHPHQQQQHPAGSQQLLEFGRLRITSPDVTPQGSPRPQHLAAEAAAGPQSTAPVPPISAQARSQPATSLCQQQQQRCQAPPAAFPFPLTQPQSPGSGDENWFSVPPSPSPSKDLCCNQEGTGGAPPLAASPSLLSHSWHGSQLLIPEQGAGAAAEPSASPPAGTPLLPFNSSQERQHEIALLLEMAAGVAAAWNSQEEETVAAPQQQLLQGQQQPQPQRQPPAPVQQPFKELWAEMLVGHPTPPPPPQAPEVAQGGTKLVGGSQVAASRVASHRGHPYICSLTSQELVKAADPWSQPGRSEGEQQQQPATEGGQRGMELDSQHTVQQGRQLPSAMLATSIAAAGASTFPPMQQQFAPQQGSDGDGLNQEAALGPGPQLQQAGWPAAAPFSPRAQAKLHREEQHQEREEQEDWMVACTCPIPQLGAVRESFPTQREAFAAADRYNRHMPLAAQPAVIMSKVPLEELLPPPGSVTAAAPADSSGGAQSSSSVGGGGGSTLGSGSRQPGGAQHAESGSYRKQQAGVVALDGQAPNGPGDFLTRYRAGVHPAVDSAGYAVLRRQRKEAADEEEEAQKQQQQQAASRSAREEYEAALQAYQMAVVREQREREHRHVQAAGAAQQLMAAPTSSGGSSLQVAADLMARDEVELRQEAVRTFCVERRGRSGTFYRTFTASSYPAMWRLFRRMPPDERHWYEVIREGRPAHLYFDLEFVPRLNPQVKGDKLVDVLLLHVATQLRHHYGLHLDQRCVYELDSSTPNKFSRHLTLRLPGHAFANNHAMGKFVGQVLAASGRELLVVRGEGEGGGGGAPPLGSIVDMAVYSKNRHWRMSYCCKGGKIAVLRPTARYATRPGAGVSAACVFLDTLVCNVEPHARLLQMPDPLPPAKGGARAGSLVPSAVQGGTSGLSALRVDRKQDAMDSALPPEQTAEVQWLAEKAIKFVEGVATQRAGGAPTRARTLAFCGGGARVAYSMIGPGSHYCENVGRPHASNHVFFVVDFAAGAYAQKCHDPDCARFRSTWMPLQRELCLVAAVEGAAGPLPPSPPASEGSAGGRG